MFKNKMNLTTLVGILNTSFALFFFSTAMEMFYNPLDIGFIADPGWKEWLYLLFAIGYLGTSIALIFRKKWARIAMYFILFIQLIIFTLFLISTVDNIKHSPFNFLGLASVCYGLLFFGLYILSNKYFLEHFENSIPFKEESPDILDSDL